MLARAVLGLARQGGGEGTLRALQRAFASTASANGVPVEVRAWHSPTMLTQMDRRCAPHKHCAAFFPPHTASTACGPLACTTNEQKHALSSSKSAWAACVSGSPPADHTQRYTAARAQRAGAQRGRLQARGGDQGAAGRPVAAVPHQRGLPRGGISAPRHHPGQCDHQEAHRHALRRRHRPAHRGECCAGWRRRSSAGLVFACVHACRSPALSACMVRRNTCLHGACMAGYVGPSPIAMHVSSLHA